MAHCTGKDTIRIERKPAARLHREWIGDTMGRRAAPSPAYPVLWIVVVNGKRFDAFLYRKNALACVRRLKGKT